MVSASGPGAVGGWLRASQRRRGQLFLDPSAAEVVANGGGAGEELTPREREVLLLVARGMSNHQIADALTVGDETVKSHVTAVLGKLGE